MPVKLYSQVYQGPESSEHIVVLHGLLGSSRNWTAIAKKLCQTHTVWALDLRNHGKSPHTKTMSYEEIADDVKSWLIDQGLSNVILIGHSLGGKAAMRLSVQFPELLSHLIVVDISVRAYPPRWEKEFSLLQSMPVQSLSSRKEAEALLEPEISDWGFRQFLLSNLERDSDTGGFKWAVNLPVLQENLPNFFKKVLLEGEQFTGPTSFIRGGRSRFLPDEDFKLVKGHFPDVQFSTIEGAGHNVHFDRPDDFLASFYKFMELKSS